MLKTQPSLVIPLLCFALVFGLSACASNTLPSSQATVKETVAVTDDVSTIMIEDAWVKSASEGMSAAFGTIVNHTSQDITVVSATTPAAAMVELHETVEDADGQMVMREKSGGFVIPANSSYALAPGSDHLMLMDLTQPIEAGSTTDFVLTTADGSIVEFTAPVKDYTGAEEHYVEH